MKNNYRIDLDNIVLRRAKNLYHSLEFKEVADGFGFDGTPFSTVEIVFFKKKSTPFTKENLQMLTRTNVKQRDLEREKIIFENLKKKENK